MIDQSVQTKLAYDSAVVERLFREGEYPEAKKHLKGLLKASDDDKVLFAVNNLSSIADMEGDYVEALRLLTTSKPLADKCTDDLLLAKYHLNLGGAFEGIARKESIASYFDRALTEYDGSAHYFHEATHRDEWCALNNAAYLLIRFQKWPEVHSYLDRAQAVFTKRDDEDKQARLAEIDDTRAQAYLSQGLIEMAVIYATQAVRGLVNAGEPRLYIQVKRTLERALEAQERSLTEWALKEAEGSVPEAAKILVMSRQGLRKRLLGDEELMSLAKFCEPRGISGRG